MTPQKYDLFKILLKNFPSPIFNVLVQILSQVYLLFHNIKPISISMVAERFLLIMVDAQATPQVF